MPSVSRAQSFPPKVANGVSGFCDVLKQSKGKKNSGKRTIWRVASLLCEHTDKCNRYNAMWRAAAGR